MQDHKIDKFLSGRHDAEMAITRHQIRAARAMLGLTAADLARLARLGAATIRRAETDGGVTEGSRFVIQHALEHAGVVFIDDEQSSPRGGEGVRLRSPRARDGD